MNFFRRFFDSVAVDAQAPPPVAPANIAELMVKQGVRTETETPVAVPDIKIEEPAAKPAPPEPPKAETAAEAPKEPKPEAPKPPEPVSPPPAPAVTTHVVQQPPAPPDWKEVLKQHPDPAEVLKAIGFEDKHIAFYQKWKNGDDIKQYLEAVSVDYSKMSPEELMKRQLQRDYPGMEAEDYDELFRMKVIENYKLDPDLFSEQDIKRGKILLNADARKVREEFIKQQQEHMLPPAPKTDPLMEQQKQEELQRQQEAEKQFETYKQTVTDDTFTKDVIKSKLLTIGEGDEAFKYEVAEPEKLLDLIFDAEKWSKSFFDEDGKPNARKHLLMAALLADEETFFKEYAKHFKKVGAKAAIDPIENASLPGGKPVVANEFDGNPAVALARAGVITG